MSWAGVVAVTAFVSSVLLVGIALWYARRTGIIDVPNSRSSHKVATPRGGGIGLVLSTAVVLALQAYRFRPTYIPELLLLGLAIVALALVGWRDDRGLASMGVRFAIQVAAAFALATLINRIEPLEGWRNLVWVGVWAFWTLSAINVFNFMDGIDGMIAGQAAVFGFYVGALAPRSSVAALSGIILACSSMGFLVWNWPPARIFMGDVGSAPLGLFIVFVGALTAAEGVTPALVFLPLFPLFFDATATLLQRWRRGESLTTAHRSHLYQRLANDRWGHGVVTAWYALGAILGGFLGLALEGTQATIIASAVLTYLLVIAVTWVVLDRQFPGYVEQRTRVVDRLRR
jgi:Fuc2NAc and GlcNAc transferase